MSHYVNQFVKFAVQDFKFCAAVTSFPQTDGINIMETTVPSINQSPLGTENHFLDTYLSKNTPPVTLCLTSSSPFGPLIFFPLESITVGGLHLSYLYNTHLRPIPPSARLSFWSLAGTGGFHTLKSNKTTYCIELILC